MKTDASVRLATIAAVKTQLREQGVAEAMMALKRHEPHLWAAIRCGVEEAVQPLEKMGILQDRHWSLVDAVTALALVAAEAVRQEWQCRWHHASPGEAVVPMPPLFDQTREPPDCRCDRP